MRILTIILLILLNCQSFSKANNLNEFQIESMSVGESLLNFFKKSEIKLLIKSTNSFVYKDNNMHDYYTNSFIYGDVAYLDKGFITIDCMFFDEKDKKKFPGLVDNLSLTLSSNEVAEWMRAGYK